MSRMVSLLVLVGIIVVFGVLFYQVMASFLLPLFLACVLVVMFRPVHNWYLARVPGARLAALVTTITVVLVVVVPVTIVVVLATIEASTLLTKLNDKAISTKVSTLRKSLGLEVLSIDEQRYIQASLDAVLSQPPGTVAFRSDGPTDQRLPPPGAVCTVTARSETGKVVVATR